MENFLLSFIGILITSSQIISSSGDEKSRTYLCFKACSAVSLCFGLNTSSLLYKNKLTYGLDLNTLHWIPENIMQMFSFFELL